ncbi:MAG: cytochrome c biogenesis protein CcdA, partial [Chloroflexota bacterium]
LIAFIAGLLSFLSPCVLPLVPAYIAHLTGISVEEGHVSRSWPTTLLHSAIFVVGFSVVFITMGASVGLVGFVLREQLPLLSRLAGVVLIVLGLNMMGVFKVAALYRTRKLEYRPGLSLGYLRSFLIGLTFSVGWTPCVGPVLAAILTLAATSETVLHGAFLLVAYSLGMGVPFLAVGAALGRLSPHLRRLNRYGGTVSVISGVFLVGLGVFMLLGMMADLSSYLSFSGWM